MTRREHFALWAATLVTAATRVWGLARSPWDWDEILFSLALRHYDVASHHPHPPGFPLFIAAAKVFRAIGFSDFHALQALNVVAGVLLVPAMFFFCRELGLRFGTSLSAALFLAFFPNVWFFGETAFSDVPSVVLVVFACGLLLRGRTSDAAYVAGAAVLAIAGGFRPQNLVIGFAPAILATWSRIRARRRVAIASAVAIGAAILVASYGAAVIATGGWQPYIEAVHEHEQYITVTDSFHNQARPALYRLLDDFFVRPYHAAVINMVVTALGLISLAFAIVRRRVPVLIAIAAFAPFCLIAWLYLDHFSASRFSIGYAPLFALLAADGAMIFGETAGWSIAVALTAGMFVWTLSAVNLARTSDSPPVQAIEWIRAHVPPSPAALEIHESLGPYAEYFLPDYRIEWTLDGPPLARLNPTPSWYMREGTIDRSGALNFTWPRDRAWNVARRRYFEIGVVPVTGRARFLEGWYGEEVSPKTDWRWMGAHGRIELPEIRGNARLRLRFFVPLHVLHGVPSIAVRRNGIIVKTIAVRDPFVDVALDFQNLAGPQTIDIDTDRTVNPLAEHISGDSRDLGLRLDALEWIPL